jgi:hypothetical protein
LKMVVSPIIHVDSLVSLSIVFGVLVLALIWSVLSSKNEAKSSI